MNRIPTLREAAAALLTHADTLPPVCSEYLTALARAMKNTTKRTSIETRPTPPDEPTDRHEPNAYRVWYPVFNCDDQNPPPWACGYMVQNLCDALDIIADNQLKGGRVCFQSPNGCAMFTPDDRLAVYGRRTVAARVRYWPENRPHDNRAPIETCEFNDKGKVTRRRAPIELADEFEARVKAEGLSYEWCSHRGIEDIGDVMPQNANLSVTLSTGGNEGYTLTVNVHEYPKHVTEAAKTHTLLTIKTLGNQEEAFALHRFAFDLFRV